MAVPSDSEPLGYLHCPGCGKMVKLPATVCPFCQANMRTGERPEQKVSITKRRGFKTLILLIILLIPTVFYFTSTDAEGLTALDKLKDKIFFGLDTCADAPPRMWDADNREEDKREVKRGYNSWREQKKTRPRGQEQFPPETNLSREQREVNSDRRNYFADTLMAQGPAESIGQDNNWYRTLSGEWDIAWISGRGTPEENIMSGEWNFTWVSGGEALEDIMNVPYLWEMSRVKNPLRITSMRTYNSVGGYWEGARIFSGRIIPFRAGRNQDGSIYETFVNLQGAVEFWVFANMVPESFQVYISETRDNGQTYTPVAEVWAKARVIAKN